MGSSRGFWIIEEAAIVESMMRIVLAEQVLKNTEFSKVVTPIITDPYYNSFQSDTVHASTKSGIRLAFHIEWHTKPKTLTNKTRRVTLWSARLPYHFLREKKSRSSEVRTLRWDGYKLTFVTDSRTIVQMRMYRENDLILSSRPYNVNSGDHVTLTFWGSKEVLVHLGHTSYNDCMKEALEDTESVTQRMIEVVRCTIKDEAPEETAGDQQVD
ncbi:hypothetical protein TREMEDRAFT_64338 [Tremella mesenterica DSM 1558]|uniref:uncharacterized protein n=1 Tax=Tremella mesenterica (strain ATCC 24925 / CBS 8224 / DSM 1558 / NBRC 9311 / NRRL Y-6157 / RJB 2259-6 / UBC 559-6) TaxID=578456 RepID=UPI0003F49A55|nr:uncharacterized protein TREMEDRAFT_64338 [Tremella mesenterica DSM 1558]EIW67746.1 hypothetical protein TREMEDRAFT_64338 [Tremella mesenterica DSM 1558]